MNNSRSNFYTVVDFLKRLLQSDPIVNTVVFGKTEQTDIYKKNIFPIAHIIPVQSPWNGSSISSFTFQIGVLEQRDINSVKKNDKFIYHDTIIGKSKFILAISKDAPISDINFIKNKISEVTE